MVYFFFRSTYLDMSIKILLFLIGTSILFGFKDKLLEEDNNHAVILNFPTPIVLEQLWTFREHDGLDPPEEGVVFWIGRNDQKKERFLAVTNESVLSKRVIQNLLTSGLKQHDPNLIHLGSAPARESFFHRMDLDADGCDEVLLTGRGGAGGTSLLTIFKVTDKKVRVVFMDSSRFGFRIFDEKRDGKYEIASPGFDWVVGDDNKMQPKHFSIYSLQRGNYINSRNISAAEFGNTIKKTKENGGIPLSLRKAPIIRLYD